LLEIYGTHHDPRVWEHPEQFNPARFASGNPPAFAFLPQGSGDVRQHHRCPGEDTVLALASTSLGFLLQHTTLQRDGRDARIDFGRMPALPRAPIWFVRRDAA
jgi:fatty-acid peroxygenase